MTAIVGRSPELERVYAFLESSSPQAAALVLEGAPGIGKTTLWQAGVDLARALSRPVLQARPAENEGALPLAALVDLLDGLPDSELSRLEDGERRTVESVLRGDAPEREDRLAVPRAVLATVRSLAEQGPAVVAVDDVQWLDEPSAAVLEYSYLDGTRASSPGRPQPCGQAASRPAPPSTVSSRTGVRGTALRHRAHGRGRPRPRALN